jgi:hypothetical protein
MVQVPNRESAGIETISFPENAMQSLKYSLLSHYSKTVILFQVVLLLPLNLAFLQARVNTICLASLAHPLGLFSSGPGSIETNYPKNGGLLWKSSQAQEGAVKRCVDTQFPAVLS